MKLTINGRCIDVDGGSTLLDALAVAGVEVPTLCHHPRLPSHAVCRMCLVDIVGEGQPRPACVTPATDGAVVESQTPRLQAFRRMNAQWLLARHPADCAHCEASGSCRLQCFVAPEQATQQLDYKPRGSPEHPEHVLVDHSSTSIWRDLLKCVECGLCAEACGAAGQQQYVIGFAERGFGRVPVTVFDQPLAHTKCISCGQCTLVCPTGALIEVPHWHEVLDTLAAGSRVCTVQVGPATRIAISEEFGLPPGTTSTGRMISALRSIGFDYVFDTNFAADLTVMEEGTELLARLATREDLPLFTSCCPGWVNWVEINRPDLLPHLSTTKSPQQMHGALTKRASFARSLGSDFAQGKSEPYVVSVMPCTAKKEESMRPLVRGDIDRVLTTRELARMIKARGVAFDALPEGEFDDPLGESTGAAQIFGVSGGVMEAMARTVAHLIGADDRTPLEWHQLRGLRAGVKTAEIPGVGRVAVCNGIAAAQRMLQSDAWRTEYVAIEVMACAGGCLAGGGQPKSMDPLVLEKRMQAVYALDQRAARRHSHENRELQRLYATDLQEPGSARARDLLHTTYAARGSARLLLMQLLDCVDRRDAQGAARLFHPDARWSTASGSGELVGASTIEAFVARKLPPRQYGASFARHRMESPAAIADLQVVTPTGERCRFSIETDCVWRGSHPTLVIKQLSREVLPPP